MDSLEVCFARTDFLLFTAPLVNLQPPSASVKEPRNSSG